jgi:hypothetical protein
VTTLGTGSEGNTPLSPEELADLIPSLATKEELNEWERENNLQARAWAIEDRASPADIPFDEYVRMLHNRMFDQTWSGPGSTGALRRTSEFQSKKFERGLRRYAVTCAIGSKTTRISRMR